MSSAIRWMSRQGGRAGGPPRPRTRSGQRVARNVRPRATAAAGASSSKRQIAEAQSPGAPEEPLARGRVGAGAALGQPVRDAQPVLDRSIPAVLELRADVLDGADDAAD